MLSYESQKEDEFDIYGKYIASQLRGMDIQRALRVQLQIQRLVSDARMEQLSSGDWYLASLPMWIWYQIEKWIKSCFAILEAIIGVSSVLLIVFLVWLFLPDLLQIKKDVGHKIMQRV